MLNDYHEAISQKTFANVGSAHVQRWHCQPLFYTVAILSIKNHAQRLPWSHKSKNVYKRWQCLCPTSAMPKAWLHCSHTQHKKPRSTIPMKP